MAHRRHLCRLRETRWSGFSPFRVAGFRPAPPVSAWLTPLAVRVVARGAGVRDGQCHGDGEYPSAAWCSSGGPGLGYGTCRPSAVGLSVADVPLVQGPEALLGYLLVSDDAPPRDLRVALGTVAVALCRLRSVRTRHRGPAVPAEGRCGGAGPQAHAG